MNFFFCMNEYTKYYDKLDDSYDNKLSASTTVMDVLVV